MCASKQECQSGNFRPWTNTSVCMGHFQCWFNTCIYDLHFNVRELVHYEDSLLVNDSLMHLQGN